MVCHISIKILEYYGESKDVNYFFLTNSERNSPHEKVNKNFTVALVINKTRAK